MGASIEIYPWVRRSLKTIWPRNRKAVSFKAAHGDNLLTGISSSATVGGPVLRTPPPPRP
jgi:hypothetical protein